MSLSKNFWGSTAILTIAGGAAFWLSNFAISRTPIAAEYRAALSISYFPMLLEALFGGLVIAAGVSHCLLRFFDRLPSKNPILKSVMLSFIVLVLVSLTIGGSSSYRATGDGLRYFLIGLSINAIRILALGMAIGYGYDKGGYGTKPRAAS